MRHKGSTMRHNGGGAALKVGGVCSKEVVLFAILGESVENGPAVL